MNYCSVFSCILLVAILSPGVFTLPTSRGYLQSLITKLTGEKLKEKHTHDCNMEDDGRVGFLCPAMGEQPERCIDTGYRCDNWNDCPDRSDEQNCEDMAHHIVECTDQEFTCPDWCIQGDMRCDGSPDCRGAVDEANCPNRVECKDGSDGGEEEFACDQWCIPVGWLCDGYFDCPDRRDENPARCKILQDGTHIQGPPDGGQLSDGPSGRQAPQGKRIDVQLDEETKRFYEELKELLDRREYGSGWDINNQNET